MLKLNARGKPFNLLLFPLGCFRTLINDSIVVYSRSCLRPSIALVTVDYWVEFYFDYELFSYWCFFFSVSFVFHSSMKFFVDHRFIDSWLRWFFRYFSWIFFLNIFEFFFLIILIFQHTPAGRPWDSICIQDIIPEFLEFCSNNWCCHVVCIHLMRWTVLDLNFFSFD